MKIKCILISCLIALGLVVVQPPLIAAAEDQIVTHCLENNRICIRVTFNVTCTGWNWYIRSMIYGEPGITIWNTQEIHPSDVWSDPYTLETDMFTLRFSILEIATGQIDGPYEFNFLVHEPGTCPVATCDLEPMYYMYTLRDANQPETWQPFCYVISNTGFPSIERQAQICSVAGFDHIYQATHGVYSGWVSKDCRGQSHYGWSDWKAEWYRPEFATP